MKLIKSLASFAFFTSICAQALSSPSPSPSVAPKPKYGPEAKKISLDHGYFLKHPAPDYWALSPFYTAQQTDAACSIAAVTMVINGARIHQNLTSDDKLASQSSILKKVNIDAWTNWVDMKGGRLILDQYGHYIEETFKAYGLTPVTVQVFHAQKNSEFKKQLHNALVENEKSDKDFIIANFIQGTFTGDAEAPHIAPVGAYDAKTKRVLIMDPDREWYEPYWVSEDVFLDGMATTDKDSGMTRGFVWVKVQR
jgi:Phytochelatin synthase